MRKIGILIIFSLLISFAWSETVYEIQYTTDPGGASPLEGQIVTVSGIVTATNWYSSGNANRFFISDAEGGAWHGVFVFNYDYEVELGDEVELTAEVQEYYGFTELSNLESLTVLSSGNPVPAAVEITTSELASSEAYESVLVQVNDVTVTQELDSYGQAYIDDGSGECQTDDAMYDYAPELGAEYSFLKGIVDYSYDEYGLNPRFAEDIGFAGDPGYIEGMVELSGGSGNVEDVLISTGSYSTSPDSDGEYELELPPGSYNVTASLTGYSSETIYDVTVLEDETTSGINFELMEAAELTIYDIQYTEDASGDSPYNGQVVTVSGIVSGAGFAGGNHFFLTTADGGAWNGVYVYQYDYEVAQGDNVTVTGEVSEYYGYTEITNIDELAINSSGNPIPAAVEITTGELASSEAYEGVLVKISNVTIMTLPNEYDEWYVDDDSGQCQIDNGFDAQVPDLTLGDIFDSITGLVDYSFDEYGLHPRTTEDFDTGGGPQLTSIYDIQYTEDASGDSPYLEQSVVVEGIVTASAPGMGYYISSAEGGAWNGLNVYDPDNNPAIGHLVHLAGEITEYYSFTELYNLTNFEVLSSGNPLPAAVEITTGELATEEAYESVLVKVSDVSVTQLPNDYGEWFVNDDSGECQVDDDMGIVFPGLEVGDTILSITGVVDYKYSEFGLLPRLAEDIDTGQAEDTDVVNITSISAYPNPFMIGSERNGLQISYGLQSAGEVNLSVYNIKGQKLSEIFSGYQKAGNHQLSWNGTNSTGTNQPAGIYFYQLRSGKEVFSGKLLLLR